MFDFSKYVVGHVANCGSSTLDDLKNPDVTADSQIRWIKELFLQIINFDLTIICSKTHDHFLSFKSQDTFVLVHLSEQFPSCLKYWFYNARIFLPSCSLQAQNFQHIPACCVAVKQYWEGSGNVSLFLEESSVRDRGLSIKILQGMLDSAIALFRFQPYPFFLFVNWKIGMQEW